MSLDDKIKLYENSNLILIKKYMKVLNNKIITTNKIYLYKINDDLLCYLKDEEGTMNEITFLKNNNDDLLKFFDLMQDLKYQEFTTDRIVI